jgi:hypothetical protein
VRVKGVAGSRKIIFRTVRWVRDDKIEVEERRYNDRKRLTMSYVTRPLMLETSGIGEK